MKVRGGSALAEQVVAIGLLAALLLLVAEMSVHTHRSADHQRRLKVAEGAARDTLERLMSRTAESLPLGLQPSTAGQFWDQRAYTVQVEIYSLTTGPKANPAAAGLDPSGRDLKDVLVTVQWEDLYGRHSCREEAYLAKSPR